MQREVRSTGSSIRRLFWRRAPGDTAGLVLVCEEEEIIDTNKDWVLRPLPVVELDEKLINAKSHIGAVIQMSCDDGSIVTDWRLYGLLINNMACNTAWITIGENNKDGIFHVHVIARTHVRTDSWRRTAEAVWKTIKEHPEVLRQWGVLTLDCLKSQRAHKTSALLQYMCKAPIWILSNCDPLLQMTYDIEKWELAARFKAPIDSKPDLDQANPMIAELLQCITERSCKTVEDVIKHYPEVVIKYLHRPGFESIVTNCLKFAKCTAGTWSIKNYAKYVADPSGIHCCLLNQGILPSTFDPIFYQWINKQHGKKNTICLIGPSNTGKSSFIYGFGKCCPGGEVVNGPNFNFEGLIECYWGKWEEPLIPPEVVEKFKQVSEGMPTAISVKFKKPYQLPRTPIFMTTNQVPWYWCSQSEWPLRNRMWMFEFNYDASSGSFTPRCVERSCKCRYCKLSRSGTADTSSETITGLHGTEQSLSEFMDPGLGTSKSTMGSQSMSEGIRSSTGITESGSSGGESGSNNAARSSSSTTISRGNGSNTEHGSSNSGERICSAGTRSEQSMESNSSTGCTRYDNRSDAKRTSRSGHDRGSIARDETCTTLVSMGGAKIKKAKMDISIHTEQQQLGGKVVSINKPDKLEWAQYLSWLFHRFEKQTTIQEDSLVCEETLSDSE